MPIDVTDQLIRDEWELKRLPHYYARHIDRGEGEALRDIFTEDGLIVGTFTFRGRAEICSLPQHIKARYLVTLHVVHNQTVTVGGDSAEGETYGTAQHVANAPGGAPVVYVMATRYQDKFRRVGGRWLFASRHNIIEWTETRPVRLPGDLNTPASWSEARKASP